jgi:hypothetical protein
MRAVIFEELEEIKHLHAASIGFVRSKVKVAPSLNSRVERRSARWLASLRSVAAFILMAMPSRMLAGTQTIRLTSGILILAVL